MRTGGTAFGTQELCRNYLKRDSALFLSLTVFFFFFSKKQSAQRINHENYARFREITEAIVFMTGKSLAWILRAASSCVVIIYSLFWPPSSIIYILCREHFCVLSM
ncbi:hypothetical protein NC653_034862 [Populus alba x Populus x berolinensis]|uniref:Uncharacterized protein n=1 Tax=Populus alba x Populus x berolinensis TaxID=444605 RepID=A0AAD6PXL5_9ROSI|nr:hypothetical protein NC653_034862 [Populus alba x Populus x berolinensis]